MVTFGTEKNDIFWWFFAFRAVVAEVKRNPKNPLTQTISKVHRHLKTALMNRPDGAMVQIPKKPSWQTAMRYGNKFTGMCVNLIFPFPGG